MKPFYGRKKGHALSPLQQELLDTQLPKIAIGNFTPEKKYRLEIGFGAGEFLNHISLLHPEIQFIGCEPFINGVASFLQKNYSNNANNVWLTTKSIHEVLDDIPDYSLETVYIFFPDPWPKARHHKRRLIQKSFLDKLLIKTSLIYAATDHPGYAEQILGLGFLKIDRPDFFVSTKYETKRKAGEPQYFKWFS